MQQIGVLLSTYAKRIKPQVYYARSPVRSMSALLVFSITWTGRSMHSVQFIQVNYGFSHPFYVKTIRYPRQSQENRS